MSRKYKISQNLTDALIDKKSQTKQTANKIVMKSLSAQRCSISIGLAVTLEEEIVKALETRTKEIEEGIKQIVDKRYSQNIMIREIKKFLNGGKKE